jgi:hypothetical protein
MCSHNVSVGTIYLLQRLLLKWVVVNGQLYIFGPSCCLLRLRARVLSIVEHLRPRLMDHGHVSWSMVVFICALGGICGGVNLRQRSRGS